MAAYVAGDEASFTELFRRYQPLVCGHLRRGYLLEADVQDLAQQVFLQLHRARRDFRSGQPLRPWLMTIARNVKRDFFRRTLRRKEANAPALACGRADHRFAELEHRELLDVALRCLPESLRNVVEAYWIERLPYAQISRRFRISRSAAKVRVHRALRAMRRALTSGGYLDEHGGAA